MLLTMGGECSPHAITSIISIFNSPDVLRLSKKSNITMFITRWINSFLGLEELQIELIMSEDEVEQQNCG